MSKLTILSAAILVLSGISNVSAMFVMGIIMFLHTKRRHNGRKVIR